MIDILPDQTADNNSRKSKNNKHLPLQPRKGMEVLQTAGNLKNQNALEKNPKEGKEKHT